MPGKVLVSHTGGEEEQLYKACSHSPAEQRDLVSSAGRVWRQCLPSPTLGKESEHCMSPDQSSFPKHYVTVFPLGELSFSV